MVKFKENVTGFIYDSMNGDIMEIFTEPIPDNIRVYGEDIVLFDDSPSRHFGLTCFKGELNIGLALLLFFIIFRY